MYDKSLIDSLFEKAKTKITDVASLDELTHNSFDEFCEKVGKTLSYTENQLLYSAAEKASQQKVAERRKHLVRGNPQLRQARSLDIQPLENHTPEKSSHRTKRAADGMNKCDEDRLLNRDSQYVPAGHVASMFSPAAYLSELYREAVHLHDDENARSLKKRRRDLANLVLSQENQDEEVSTLSLSNALLLEGCQAQTSELSSKEKVLEKLATHRLSDGTPYHHAFQAIRHALKQNKMTSDKILNTLVNTLTKNEAWLRGMFANTDPELYGILREDIPENDQKNLINLFKNNFKNLFPNSLKTSAQNQTLKWLLNTNNLAHYYDIPVQTIEKKLSTFSVNANNIDL